MKNWVIQYVYATDKTEQGVSISVVEAETYEDARDLAIKKAQAEEFIFTIHPQSEDQYLGAVKHKANIIAGNAETHDNIEDLDPDKP